MAWHGYLGELPPRSMWRHQRQLSWFAPSGSLYRPDNPGVLPPTSRLDYYPNTKDNSYLGYQISNCHWDDNSSAQRDYNQNHHLGLAYDDDSYDSSSDYSSSDYDDEDHPSFNKQQLQPGGRRHHKPQPTITTTPTSPYHSPQAPTKSKLPNNDNNIVTGGGLSNSSPKVAKSSSRNGESRRHESKDQTNVGPRSQTPAPRPPEIAGTPRRVLKKTSPASASITLEENSKTSTTDPKKEDQAKDTTGRKLRKKARPPHLAESPQPPSPAEIERLERLYRRGLGHDSLTRYPHQ